MVMLEHRAERLAGVGIVVHDENVYALEGRSAVDTTTRALHGPRLSLDRRVAGRETHREGRSQPFPRAFRVHGTPVQLHQVTDDRQPESEAAVLPRAGAVGLPEAIEDVRKEIGADALASVADRDPGAPRLALEPDSDSP